MEQIIYLEIDDDIPIIRDRLEWAQAQRVLLVVPALLSLYEDFYHRFLHSPDEHHGLAHQHPDSHAEEALSEAGN